MTSFEESVRDIEGLSDFKPGVLPEWLSERLHRKKVAGKKTGYSNRHIFAKADLEWLGDWGKATINGEEVFLFLFRSGLGYYSFESAMWADELECGWQEVEGFRLEGKTMFFTEHGKRVLHRRTANSALAVN